MTTGKNFDGLKTPISDTRLIKMCSLCIDEIDLDRDECVTMVVNGRRAFYHKSCIDERRDQ